MALSVQAGSSSSWCSHTHGEQTVFSEHVLMKLGSAVEWRWEELSQGTVRGDLAGGGGYSEKRPAQEGRVDI